LLWAWTGELCPGSRFRSDQDDIKVAPLAKVVEDLDNLPLPDRLSIDYESHPMPTASILGSRGCPWDCSFCSIRPFYEEQGGPLRRLRKPQAIVDEMIDLHRNRKVPIFLFRTTISWRWKECKTLGNGDCRSHRRSGLLR